MSETSRRQRDQRQVRALLREQAGPQWAFLAFLWVFCVVGMWLLRRFLLDDTWPWFFVLTWATVLVAIEAVRQHGRVRKVGHARDADPLLVEVTDLGPRLVTVEGPQGRVRLPVASTSGLEVGRTVWAAPAPVAGERVVLVRNQLRPGSLDLVTPRGPAEPA